MQARGELTRWRTVAACTRRLNRATAREVDDVSRSPRVIQALRELKQTIEDTARRAGVDLNMETTLDPEVSQTTCHLVMRVNNVVVRTKLCASNSTNGAKQVAYNEMIVQFRALEYAFKESNTQYSASQPSVGEPFAWMDCGRVRWKWEVNWRADFKVNEHA